MNTYPGLIQGIVNWIKKGGEKSLKIFDDPKNSIDVIIKEALMDQIKIGDKSLEKGFCAKKWKEAQRQWNKDSKDKLQADIWNKKLIILLHQYIYSMWKKQNEFVHGTERRETNKMKRKRLKNHIKELFGRTEANLHTKSKNYLNYQWHKG